MLNSVIASAVACARHLQAGVALVLRAQLLAEAVLLFLQGLRVPSVSITSKHAQRVTQIAYQEHGSHAAQLLRVALAAVADVLLGQTHNARAAAAAVAAAVASDVRVEVAPARFLPAPSAAIEVLLHAAAVLVAVCHADRGRRDARLCGRHRHGATA